uniref:Serpin domain-containing protein n=1 Tax=Anopheles darlingi TaxID=43151 RepID=A0A2K6VB06_ANODA
MWTPLALTLMALLMFLPPEPGVAQFYSLSFGTEEETFPATNPPSSPATATAAGPPLVKQEVRQKVTPLDAMIDRTNHLGFRVLHQHSKGNKNNIALSPCALASILVALYEGSGGRSAAELYDQLVVPYDKDVLRVGYRDIHRRLRSYFYQKENLLNGLSLSSENITIRPEYESVLKFYGYDLDSIPEMRMPSTTTTTTLLPPTTDETTEMESDVSDSTVDLESTTPVPVETTTTFTSMSEEPTTPSISTDASTVASTTEALEGSGDASTVNQEPDETTDGMITETEAATEPNTEQPTTVESDDGTAEPPADAPEADGGGEKRRRNLRKRGHRRHSPDSPHRRRSLRTKRQPEEIDIASHQRFLQSFLLQDVVAATPTTTTSPLISIVGGPTPRTNPFFQQPAPDAYRLLEDTIEHNFYLTETEIVRVPYKVYNTILKYAYIERLHSTVIELELDSEDYRLLLILPDYEFGLGNVLKLLQIGDNVPNLRDITSQMSATWVKTIVPKFSLKGSIVLTSDLQNLGINDIFEPARADFSLMTDDSSIYAKHIEQSININIRTHSLQQLKRFTSLYKNPVELAVNYPFLFCILDNELDLALMVGRILNPLNSRIH